MQLTVRQNTALEELTHFMLGSDSRYVLSGVSGSGKTQVITELLLNLHGFKQMHQLIVGSDFKADIVLAATTHKAANVLYERTKYPCTTIHSLLGLRQQINYQTGQVKYVPSRYTKPVKNKIVIIDEASMIDNVFLDLIDEYMGSCKVLFVMDKYQATPVKCNYVPVARKKYLESILNDPVRYGKYSHVDKVSKELREYIDGNRKSLPILDDGISVINCSKEDYKRHITTMMSNPKHTEETGKILAWTNKRVFDYNDYCRGLHHSDKTLNPGEQLIVREPVIKKNSIVYPSERHITIQSVDTAIHNYEKIDYYEVMTTDLQTLRVPYDRNQLVHVLNTHKGNDWYQYFELKEMFLDARPIYASTIHCSQGSTFGDVFIDVGDLARNRNNNDVARLLYVALTRAKNKVYLNGYIR